MFGDKLFLCCKPFAMSARMGVAEKGRIENQERESIFQFGGGQEGECST
jgi:hypothetical protein